MTSDGYDVGMTTMTIRNVPDTVKEKLVREAKRHRRSLNQQVLVFLENACANSPGRGVEAELEEIRAMRRGVPSMSAAEIDRAKRDGRV
jgi:plasmid stability protein